MLETYISELLFKYDSVILPGFGAFILKYVPASIHPVENKLSPPSKIISFDPALNNNDGILANHISEKKRISFIEANHEILHFVDELNKALSEGKQIVLQKLGRLSRSGDGIITFLPDTSTNYYLETSGMEDISFHPVLRGDIKERLQKQFSENTRIVNEKKKFYKSAIWIVSAVVIVFFAITIPFTNFDFIFKRSAETENQVVSDKPIIKEVSNKKENIPPVDTPKTDTSGISKNTSVQADGKKYYVISASFRIKENADKYVETLKNKGYQPESIYLEDKGLYAVSYHSFVIAADADSELSKIRGSENPGAWILYH